VRRLVADLEPVPRAALPGATPLVGSSPAAPPARRWWPWLAAAGAIAIGVAVAVAASAGGGGSRDGFSATADTRGLGR
jgi:ferric-dicitrate binding protein FerR (iron transport regulator)